MSKFNLEQFAKTVENIVDGARKEDRLMCNPSDAELIGILKKVPGVKKTRYGSFVAPSEPTSRAAMFTKNSIDHSFGREEKDLLSQCEREMGKEKLICVDRIVGNKNSKRSVRLIVPENFAHVAYGGRNLFLPPKEEIKEPTYQIIMFPDRHFESNKEKPLPEKDITIRLAMLDDGRVVKIVRNSSYIGEYKKGVFAAEDWTTKSQNRGIFLHAGCREDYLESAHGDYRRVRSLFVALSANGKTTTTCQILARKEKEESWLIQDDGGALLPDGSFEGFEGGAVYAKTEGVNPGQQMEIFYGLLKPDTVCENVYITEKGGFDFYNLQKTSNGRAVIKRRHIMHAAPYIDVNSIDNLVLITRGPLIPAISKLTAEQAAALMILGQAMESSAGDPTKAGKIRSQFFYDPFISGERSKHANIFYETIKGLPDLNYYLINTGGIGEGKHYKGIEIRHTLGILDSLVRGGLEDWVDSPIGFKVPRAIRVVDNIYMHPESLYSKAKFEEKQKELINIRREAISKTGSGLYPEVKKSLI